MVIDHIAIQVDNVQDSAYWYEEQYGCSIEYCDSTWALLQFENIKLALVVKEEHPPHIAFEVDKMDDDWPMKGKLHRDGSISRYIDDPSGNKIELIKYPKQTKHFADGFHEGRWEDDKTLDSDNCYSEFDE